MAFAWLMFVVGLLACFFGQSLAGIPLVAVSFVLGSILSEIRGVTNAVNDLAREVRTDRHRPQPTTPPEK